MVTSRPYFRADGKTLRCVHATYTEQYQPTEALLAYLGADLSQAADC